MPERVIRWLHLSDFHCGKEKENYPLEANLKDLIKHIKERCQPACNLDFIFITGDVANKGLPEHYELFRGHFLEPLQGIIGADLAERVFVVPGNHDVDRPQTSMMFKAVTDFLGEFPAILQPTREGQDLRGQIIKRFAAFGEAALCTGLGDWLASEEGCWAKRLEINGVKLGLLGVNSTWFANGEHDAHKLSCGSDILHKGLDLLEDTEIKLVLAHHPLGWMEDAEEKRIRQNFADHKAIYLHGHLHKTGTGDEDGGSGRFRVFQSGAVFEPKAGDPWRTRINWAELHADQGLVYIEPLALMSGEWRLDTTAFANRYFTADNKRYWFPLPGREGATPPSEPSVTTQPSSSQPPPAPVEEDTEEIKLPNGWWGITKEYLSNQKGKAPERDALAYFDGMEPTWALVMSTAAPRLDKVYPLRDKINAAIQSNELSAMLLIGPSGEGKSTVLRHAIAEMVEGRDDLLAIWQSRPGLPLPMDFVEKLPYIQGHWLVAIDEADMIASNIREVMLHIREQNRGDVHFLLASRDSAWLSLRAKQRDLSDILSFSREEIRGLNKEEAEAIVKAWSLFGPDGLANLAGKDLDRAAQLLLQKAIEGAPEKQGAFFGALLETRYGQAGLRARLNRLLESFKGKLALTGLPLHKAYAYVAAPHAVGIDVLTKDILARVWKCRPGDVLPVLQRFGKEAFLAVPGRFITTRHQKIAKAACELLREQFGVDMDEVYVDLLRAAVEVLKHGGDVVMTPWNGLPDYFRLQGRQDLALWLARVQCEAAPTKRSMVKLSHLLRKTGNAPEAARLFRVSGLRPPDDRAFYFEWGTAEGEAGRHAISAWMAAYSLADAGGRDALDRETAKKCLAGLGMAFSKLHEATHDLDYALAPGAVGQLGPSVADDSTTLRHFQTQRDTAAMAGVGEQPPAQAWQAIESAIKKAWAAREEDLPGIPPASGFTYKQLLNLLNLPQDAPT